MDIDWSVFGIFDLEEHFPDIAGKFSGTLLIVGGGRCVYDDLQRTGYPNNPDAFHVMCINDIYMHFPGPVDHFYSNDARFMPNWLAARRELLEREFSGKRKLHTHSMIGGARYRWPWPGHGTSALSATYTGLALGYEKIILCGVPLDDSGHYFDPPWRKTNFGVEVADQDGEPRYWKKRMDIFRGRVFSMSGRTKALLGSP